MKNYDQSKNIITENILEIHNLLNSTYSKIRAILTLLMNVNIETLDKETLGWICELALNQVDEIEYHLKDFIG